MLNTFDWIVGVLLALAKVEAMYGADKETYHIALALVCFAIVTGMGTLLVVLAFGGEATGSERFQISTAYQRVYRFFAYLGTDPVFAGVGTFVTGIGLVYAAVAGCGRWLRSIRGLLEKVHRPE